MSIGSSTQMKQALKKAATAPKSRSRLSIVTTTGGSANPKTNLKTKPVVKSLQGKQKNKQKPAPTGHLVVESLDQALDLGRRQYQEDRAVMYDDQMAVVLAVFDGHGSDRDGHFCSDFLSVHFYDYLQLALYTWQQWPAAILDCTKKLGLRWQESAHRNCSGSTITGCVVDKNNGMLYLFNLGDSTTLVVVQGRIWCQTKPHEADPHLLSSRQKQLGAQVISDVDQDGQVYNYLALADGRRKLNMRAAFGDLPVGDEPDLVDHTPDVTTVDLRKLPAGLVTIFVCSDGIIDTDALTVEDLTGDLLNCSVQEIIDAANHPHKKEDNRAIVKMVFEWKR